jgi:2-iminobutanoate/2-iminopropanoate deaminase
MADRNAIATTSAPQAIGPYSQAIQTGNLLFASGQVGIDPATGDLVEGDVAAQTRRALENVGAVLQAAGTDFAHVVKTTVFLIDINDFAAMNEVYATFFPPPPPARSTIAVAALPKAARVEIECVALLPA